MNIVIIADMESANLGDQAIFLGLQKLLEDHNHTIAGLYLSASSNRANIDYAEAVQVPANRNGFISLIVRVLKAGFLQAIPHFPGWARRVTNLISRIRRRRKWEAQWKAAISRADLVVFGGGALLTDNDWGFPLSLYHASRLVRAHGKRYSCIACSVGIRFSPLARRWLRKFLNGCDAIGVRDYASGRRLSKLGEYEYRVFIDPAIVINKIFPVTRSSIQGRLGLNLLPRVRHEDVTSRQYASYLQKIATFVRELDRRPELGIDEVVLFNTGEELDYEVAKDFCQQYSSELQRVTLSVHERMVHLEEVVQVVTQCSVVVATRLHASILPASYGIPVIGIGWDAKVFGFYEMVGLSEYCFDYRTLKTAELLEAVRSLVGEHVSQERKLKAEREKLTQLSMFLTERSPSLSGDSHCLAANCDR